jgi:hypothetical protein
VRTAPAGRRAFRAHWPKKKWPRALQSTGATWKAFRLPLTEGNEGDLGPQRQVLDRPN